MIKTISLSLTLFFITLVACSFDYVQADDYLPPDNQPTDNRYVFETTERSLAEKGMNYALRYISNGICEESTMSIGKRIKFREIARTFFFIELEIESEFNGEGVIERHKLYNNRDKVTLVGGGTAVISGHWVK